MCFVKERQVKTAVPIAQCFLMFSGTVCLTVLTFYLFDYISCFQESFETKVPKNQLSSFRQFQVDGRVVSFSARVCHLCELMVYML
jgi:hypothetical protein